MHNYRYINQQFIYFSAISIHALYGILKMHINNFFWLDTMVTASSFLYALSGDPSSFSERACIAPLLIACISDLCRLVTGLMGVGRINHVNWNSFTAFDNYREIRIDIISHGAVFGNTHR